MKKSTKQKHVLLIGIDGIRQDAFMQAINDIEKDTAYAYFNEAIQKGKKNYLLYAGGGVTKKIGSQRSQHLAGPLY